MLYFGVSNQCTAIDKSKWKGVPKITPTSMHTAPLTSRETIPRPDILMYQFHISSRCIRCLTKNIYTIYHRYGGFLFCLAFVTSTLSLVQGITSTCESVSVNEGSATSVTCKFGDDLRNVKKNVYLDHRQENNSRHALVVSCRWTSNGYDCNSTSGYILTGNVTDTLRVNITNVDETNAGKYWCEIFGSDPHDRTTCEVCLLGISTKPTLPNIGKVMGKDESNKRALAIGFGVLIPVIICVIVFLVVKVLHYKRKRFGDSHPVITYINVSNREDS